MAEVLSEFPRRASSVKRPQWAQYVDGRVWRLAQGEDFDCPEASARVGVYQAAIRAGKKCRTARVSKHGEPTVLIVQAYEEA